MHLQKLVDIPEIPVAQLDRHIIDQDEPTLPFEINMMEEFSSIWELLFHPGTYVGIFSIVCIGVYCFKTFWCRPPSPRYLPYSPVTLQNPIVDGDVEVACIYIEEGIVENQ